MLLADTDDTIAATLTARAARCAAADVAPREVAGFLGDVLRLHRPGEPPHAGHGVAPPVLAAALAAVYLIVGQALTAYRVRVGQTRWTEDVVGPALDASRPLGVTSADVRRALVHHASLPVDLTDTPLGAVPLAELAALHVVRTVMAWLDRLIGPASASPPPIHRPSVQRRDVPAIPWIDDRG